MIAALLRVCWISLRRDRVALLLTFVLPIVFFSVFAMVFGGMGKAGTSRIRVALVDLDNSDASRRMVAALGREPGLAVRLTDDSTPPVPLDRAAAEALVRGGKRPIAIILMPGFGATLGDFTNQDPKVELLADSSDPIAAPMVQGLLQKVGMTAAPDLMAERGLMMFDRVGGGLTPEQKKAMSRVTAMLRMQAEAEGNPPATSDGAAARNDTGDSSAPAPAPANAPADAPANGARGENSPNATAPATPNAPVTTATPATTAAPAFSGPVAVRTVDVLGETKRSGMVAFYAAGTAVMFLLFSMAGAAGTLLEEEESGTLERLLGGGIGIGTVLGAKWLFHAAMGVVQITVMFIWGALVFQLELLSHLGGFAVMTLCTAAAASAFGLVLATCCRTRAQLSGLSTVVILIMSAIGGSMFPRMFMPEWTVNLGYLTFNAWALDGYTKVFWYEQPTVTLWPQVLVLVTLTAILFLAARLLARRWEAV